MAETKGNALELPWYFIQEDMLSEGEKKGDIPLPKKVTIVQLGSKWSTFSSFVQETHEIAKMAFTRTPLEFKIAPYERFSPGQFELPGPFYLRNLNRFGAGNKFVSFILEAAAKDATEPKDFVHHSFGMPIYSGNEILSKEEVIQHTGPRGEKGRVRTHLALRYDKNDISLSTGFNEGGRWWYATGLKSSQWEEPYRKFTRGLGGIDNLNLLKKEEKVDKRFGIEYTVYS